MKTPLKMARFPMENQLKRVVFINKRNYSAFKYSLYLEKETLLSFLLHVLMASIAFNVHGEFQSFLD